MKKNNVIVMIITAFIIILILGSLFVYASSNGMGEQSMQEKVSQEINYLDNYLISLLGQFNGVTVGDDVFQITPKESEDESQSSEEISKQQGQNGEGQQGGQGSQNEQAGQGGQEQQGGQSSQGGSSEQNEQGTLGGNGESKGQSSSQNENQNSQTNVQKNGKNSTNILANNGKYEANWDTIKTQIEEIYQTWNTVCIDLHSLNVDGNNILAFSNGLNNATQRIKENDKTKSMNEIGKLYSLLPIYMKSIDTDERKTEMLYIKSKIVSAYIATSAEDWNTANTELTDAEQHFANILNAVGNEKQTTMNQCYILVNELRNAVNLKDKDIFFINYKNLIPKVQMLT